MYEESMYENEFIKFFKTELMKRGFSSGSLAVEHRESAASEKENVAIVFEGTDAFYIYELVIADGSREKGKQLQAAEDELRKYVDDMDYQTVKAYLVWLEEVKGHKKYEEYEVKTTEPKWKTTKEEKPEPEEPKWKTIKEKKSESDKAELRAAEEKESEQKAAEEEKPEPKEAELEAAEVKTTKSEQMKEKRLIKKRKKRGLTIICFSGAAIMLMLLVMSFFRPISDKQILLLVMAIFLLIFPFCKKIIVSKFIEIEPKEEEEHKSST